MMRALLILFLLILLGITALFGYQNQEPLNIHFANFWVTAPTWVPTGISVLGTLILFLLYGMISGTGWRVRYRRLRAEAESHLREIESLNRDNLDLREELAKFRFGTSRSDV